MFPKDYVCLSMRLVGAGNVEKPKSSYSAVQDYHEAVLKGYIQENCL